MLYKLKQERYVFLLFAVVIFLLYAKSLFFKFTYLDDNQLLINRTHFLDNFANIIKSFQEPVFYLAASGSTYYRPILNVFFILEYNLFSDNFFLYHLFNIILHLLNTFLVYKFFTKFKVKNTTSIASALIFGVHPVLTQAVGWIPGINDLLLALFLLPSIIYFIDYLENGSNKNLFFYILFFSLSIFTKESAILLIFVYALIFFFVKNKRSIKKFLIIFLPQLLTIGAFLYLRFRAVQLDVPGSYAMNSILTSFVGGFLVNIGKILFPVNLFVIPILYESNYLYGIASIVIVLLVILISKYKNGRLIIIGATLFVVSFLPTLINPTPGDKLVMFEHRLYIPLIGVLLVLIGTSVYTKYFIGKKLYILVIIVFSVLTFVHLDDFQNQYTFWRKAAAIVDIFPVAKANLAYVYYRDGKVDDAKRLLTELAETEHRDYAYDNLGMIATYEGDFDKAMDYFKKSLKFNPLNSTTYLFMAYVYKYKNDIPNAKNYFLYAVYTDNDNIEAMMNLASIYLDEGNTQRAQLIYDEVKKHGVEY